MKHNGGSFLLILFLLLGINTYSQYNDFKVVGYFPNWANMTYDIDNLDCTKLTHINWAFLNPDANGNLGSTSENRNLKKLVDKAHKYDVKVLISLGGGSASTAGTIRTNYFNLISTETKRAGFIHKISEYIKAHDLQGVDVDYEGSAINSNYDAFIKQLCDTLRPQKFLITAALGGGAYDDFSDTTIPLFDWINIMSYDATGSWTPDSPGQHASYEFAVEGVEKWAKRGASKEQLVVGLPFYGHAFKDLLYMDYYNYNQIIKVFPDCYKYDERGNVIYYNGISTIQKKTYMALDRAGGVMIWALSYDVYNEYSLLKAIDDARKKYNPEDKAPVVTLVSPSSNITIDKPTLEVVASAVDEDGVYDHMELSVNDRILGKSTSDTATFLIQNLSDGKYNVAIMAVDHQNRSSSKSFVLTVSGTERMPFNGIPTSLPGLLEAENYDVGANNRTFYDNELTNQGGVYRSDVVDIESCSDTDGGYNVGWIASGEWLEYTVDVQKAGIYQVEARVATSNSNKKFHLMINGKDVSGSIQVPNTGAWQTWKTATSKEFQLEAGIQVIRVKFDSGDFNLNSLNFVCLYPTSFYEPNEMQKRRLYPNPTTGDLLLDMRENKVQASVVNAAGQIVLNREVSSNGNVGTLFVGQLPRGIYKLLISSSETNVFEVLPFVKK